MPGLTCVLTYVHLHLIMLNNKNTRQDYHSVNVCFQTELQEIVSSRSLVDTDTVKSVKLLNANSSLLILLFPQSKLSGFMATS